MKLLPVKQEFRWSYQKKGKQVFNICTQFVMLHGLALGLLASASSQAYANPAGGTVTAGSATITSVGSQVEINQTTNRAIINWSSFDIASGETTKFIQPDTSSLTLNRVTTSGQISTINGNLLANGHVLIINPNGVLIGPNGNVNVAGFVASSADIDDNAFMTSSGGMHFGKAGKAGAIVENRGHITIGDTGLGLLVAPTVRNSGVIEGNLARLQMGAGDTFGVDMYGDGLLNLAVSTSGAKRTLTAQNAGKIIASGGKVLMTAAAASDVVNSVINTSGVVEARTLVNQGGQIILKGAGASVNVSGTLDASAPNGGDGGFIDTSGAHVNVSATAKITTAAPEGKTGQWLIDPNDYFIAASGGDITGAVLSSALSSTNVTILSADGATAGNGDIFVNDAVSWSANNTLTLSAYRNINVNADITATGNTAGLTLTPDTGGGGGSYWLNNGSVITLSGGSPSLNIAGHAYTVINDLNALQNINSTLTGYYALGSDIDASDTVNWNSGAGFAPIGVSAQNQQFSGLFDGMNHSISNLYINRPTQSSVGLFGRVYGISSGLGIIRNVSVSGSVTGNRLVGGVAGAGYHSTIDNAHASVSVTAVTDDVGGLIGDCSDFCVVKNSSATGNVSAGSYLAGGLVGLLYHTGASITNSYATGNVSSPSSGFVGGLVGQTLDHASISNSYATGNVTAIGMVGGFIGDNDGTSTISDSYATGNVTGNTYAGGFTGFNNDYAIITRSYSTGAVNGTTYVGGFAGYNDQTAVISNSYSTGSVSGNNYVGGFLAVNDRDASVSTSYATGAVVGNLNVGGFLGYQWSGTIKNSFWDIQASGQSTSAAGTGLTTVQMMMQASFSGFNFTNVWTIDEGLAPPLLRDGGTSGDPPGDVTTTVFDTTTSTGSTTACYSAPSAAGSEGLFGFMTAEDSIAKDNGNGNNGDSGVGQPGYGLAVSCGQ